MAAEDRVWTAEEVGKLIVQVRAHCIDDCLALNDAAAALAAFQRLLAEPGEGKAMQGRGDDFVFTDGHGDQWLLRRTGDEDLPLTITPWRRAAIGGPR